MMNDVILKLDENRKYNDKRSISIAEKITKERKCLYHLKQVILSINFITSKALLATYFYVIKQYTKDTTSGQKKVNEKFLHFYDMKLAKEH